MSNARRAAGIGGCGLYGVLSLLWNIAGILFFVSILLALFSLIPWGAVVGWFVVVLVLAGLRALAGRAAARILEPLLSEDDPEADD